MGARPRYETALSVPNVPIMDRATPQAPPQQHQATGHPDLPDAARAAAEPAGPAGCGEQLVRAAGDDQSDPEGYVPL